MFAGHAEEMGGPQAAVTFATELRLFLKPSDPGGVRVPCDLTSSLGHVVELLGVPLTEVGRLVVNGELVMPGYRPGGGDVVEVAAVPRHRNSTAHSPGSQPRH